MDYYLVTRRWDTVAFTMDDRRIGSFDRMGGANRGTIGGLIVAWNYSDWTAALDALESF